MIARYAFGGFVLFLAASLSIGSAAAGQQLFFDRPPFVHPKIIKDLSTWASDSGEQVIAINLLESINTNRYYGDVETSGKERPFVYYEEKERCEEEGMCPMGPPFFGYKLVGKTSSGVFVLFTEWSGGGSGRFRELLFVTIEKDKGLTGYTQGVHALRLERERLVIKRAGNILLGDRYEGDISVRGNVVHIGKDEYARSAGFFPNDVMIEVE